MQVSARVLGQSYGLTGEEMNRVLKKNGILQGSSGNYTRTPKAMEYAVEKEVHRGTGGYSWYNRYWTERTFDESIKDVLDVSDALINEVRSEIAEERAARRLAQAAARAKADADFLARQAAEAEAREAAEKEAKQIAGFVSNCKKGCIVAFAITGVVAIGYGIYKVTPKVKQWWHDRKERNTTDGED